jgi:hypothetical protein
LAQSWSTEGEQGRRRIIDLARMVGNETIAMNVQDKVRICVAFMRSCVQLAEFTWRIALSTKSLPWHLVREALIAQHTIVVKSERESLRKEYVTKTLELLANKVRKAHY